MKLDKILLVFSLLFELILSTNWDQKLQQDLYANYNKFVFPSDSTISHKIQVEFSSLIEVNTIKNQATIRIILREWWEDPRMAWNASDYDNITETVFPSDPQLDGVWIPDLMIYEAAEKPMQNLGQMRIRVRNKGEIYWCRLGLVTLNLQMNLHKYPFDVQYIRLTFESWRFPATELQLSFYDPPLIKSGELFTENVGWTILGLDTRIKTIDYGAAGVYTTLYFWITIKRAAETLVNTLIIPSIGIGLLGLFYYFMPRGNGERVNFLATLLLTEVMLLVILTQYLPASKSDPILENFLLVLTLMLKFTLASAIAMDYLERKFKKKKKKTLLFKYNEENKPLSYEIEKDDKKLDEEENSSKKSSDNLVKIELSNSNLGNIEKNKEDNGSENIEDNENDSNNNVKKIDKKKEEVEIPGIFDMNDFDINNLVFNEPESKNDESALGDSNESRAKLKQKNSDKSISKSPLQSSLDSPQEKGKQLKSSSDDNKNQNLKKQSAKKSKLSLKNPEGTKKNKKLNKKDLIAKIDLYIYGATIIVYLGFCMYYLIKWNQS